MEKKRLLVACIPQIGLLRNINALTTVLGKQVSARIPPHVTLIPPLNTDATQLPSLRQAIRNAVESFSEETLILGPVGSFWPKNPAIFLKAFSDDDEQGKSNGVNDFLYKICERLSGGEFSPPVSRSSYSFMPHVTISYAKTQEEVDRLTNFFSGYKISGIVNSIALLEQVLSTPDKAWKIIDEPYFGKREKVNVLGISYDICYEKVLSPYDMVAIGLTNTQNTDAPTHLLLHDISSVIPDGRPITESEGEASHFVIALRNFAGGYSGGMLGGAIVNIRARVAYVRWLFVSSEIRGSGVGLLLMRQAERLAADCACDAVTAMVPEASAAIGFFEKLGYRRVGSIQEDYLPRAVDVTEAWGVSDKKLCFLSKFLGNRRADQIGFVNL